MGILDSWDYDDDPENEERKRGDDELNRYKDMLKDGTSGISSVEVLEELVNYCYEKEKYEDASILPPACWNSCRTVRMHGSAKA